jgi:hypothetical protein
MLKIKILVVLTIFTVLFTGCSTVNVTSKWADSVISIDGVDDEWQNGVYYIKDHNLLLGIKNDDENFYFALITSDESNRRQILMGGLTLWFNNEGGSDKKFGIRFPSGIKAPDMLQDKEKTASGIQGQDWQGQMPDSGQGKGTGGMQGGPDFSKMEAAFTDLEILGPGEKDVSRMNVNDAKGIAVKMKLIDDKLVYEFKIALKKKDASSYAIGINEDNAFSLGIETTAVNTKTGKGSQGGDAPDGDAPGGGPGGMPPGGGGGMPPGGGGPGGMPPGGGPGGSSASQEPLSYWLNVTLSHKN